MPDSLLKTALLCRAVTDVKRIWRVRDDKPALSNLHQRGLVGDDTMARFAQAEKELEAEIVDVVAEANTFRPGWGGMIFATATEMAHAERNREIVMSVPRIKMAEGVSNSDVRVGMEADNPEKKLNQRRRFLPEDKLPKVAQPVAPNPAQQAAMLAQMQAQAQAAQLAQRGPSPQPALPTTIVPSAETPLKGTPSGLNTPASTGKTATGGGQSAASTPSKVSSTA